MIHIRKISLQFLLTFIVQIISAQQGSPLLTHFLESRDIENQSWAICQDDNNIMLFATRRGVLALDGQDWDNIRIPTIPFAMRKNPADGKIYIGGDGNFGFLEKDESGLYKYISLSGDSARIGVITSILFGDGCVWFYSDDTIIRLNTETGKSDLILVPESGFSFTGMFVTQENTFINVSERGLHRIDSDTLFPIVTGYLTAHTSILFSIPYSDERVLIGQSDGRLLTFDGLKYYNYPVNDDGYLEQNILSEGIAIGDTAFAFSTLEGGAIVIEKKSGNVLYTINNQNELPDDEIFAIGSDLCGGLWLSHQYGLTRADLCLPVENYTIFPGIKGNLAAAVMHQKELYVATSEGVFYLDEVKNYTETEVYVKNVIPGVSVPKSALPEAMPQLAGRKNIFSRIFGKKTSPEKPEQSPGYTEDQTDNQSSTPVVPYTRKKVNKLKSINYIYKKVEGLNEKCRQLVPTPYGILAATNTGLYILSDHKAEAIAPNRYINFVSWQPYNGIYYVAANDGYFSVRYENEKWIRETADPGFTNAAYTVLRLNEKTLWIGGNNCAYKADIDHNQKITGYADYNVNIDFPDRYILREINDSVFLFSGSLIHYYDNAADRFILYTAVRESYSGGPDYLLPSSNYPLIRQGDKWISPDKVRSTDDKELALLKIFDNPVFIGVENFDLWIVDGKNRLFCVDRLRSSKINPSTKIVVKSISNQEGTRFGLTDVKFSRGDNLIIFDIVAPSYLRQETTRYQYFIDKLMQGWSEWSERTHFELTIPRQGDYTIQVRAKDLWGNIGEPETINVSIKAPLTKTLAFYILLALTGLLIIILIMRFREKQLQLKNRILEEKVSERTAEIEAQKKEITASIEYASRIQMAMLPMEDHFKNLFSDYFLLFKPRDIVSGDFYWIAEDERSIFITVADCTGHGVPGAFMSTMGISTLNEIIANNGNLQANKVLNLLRNKIMRALHQTGKEGEASDGMDIAFCVLSRDRKTLHFSGAFNPLIIFKEGELREYRGDRMPIGIHYGQEKSFTNFVIPVKPGDTAYIFSDGFADQFGGPDGVKFKISNLRNLLNKIHLKPMAEQRNILELEFENWKGSSNQVDDVTIIGIRI